MGKFTHARYRNFSPGNIFAHGFACVCDTCLKCAVDQRRAIAAARFNLLKQAPYVLGERIAIAFHKPCPACRIGNAAKPAFFLRDDLRVARSPAAKFFGKAQSICERIDRNNVSAANASGKTGGRIA